MTPNQYMLIIMIWKFRSMIQMNVLKIFLVDTRCPMPIPPAHGHVSYHLFSCSSETCQEHTHAFFTCDIEYYLVGYGSIVCVGDGEWNLPVPTCEGNFLSSRRTVVAPLIRKHHHRFSLLKSRFLTVVIEAKLSLEAFW